MVHLFDRFYTGWRVHAGVFVCAMFASGCTTYIFGLFVVPVTEEFGISRATLNLGFSAFLLGNALVSPLVGQLIDKLSARWTIFSGGLMFSLGMLVIANSHSLPLMALMILGPISYAAAACGTLGANTVVAKWFKRRRGRALGIIAVATSTGGFFSTPLTALMIEHHGWRAALVAIGVVAPLCITLMTLLLIRNRPSGREPGYAREFGELSATVDKAPDATRDNAATIASSGDRVWSYAELFRTRNFWLLTIGIGLLFSSDMALIASQVPHLLDGGIELPAAALIASLMTMSAICGKLLVGYFADKVDLRMIFHAIALAHALLLVMYIVMPPYWVLLAASIFLGIAIGGVFPIWATLIAWLFGAGSYGAIMGLMTIPMNLFGMAALYFVGKIYDLYDSYVLGFFAFIITIGISMVLIAALRPHVAGKSGPDQQELTTSHNMV